MRSTFSALKTLPSTRATSVLPTPGGPVKTMCWLMAATGRFWARRCCSTCIRAMTPFTSAFTGARPTMPSRVASAVARRSFFSTAAPSSSNWIGRIFRFALS
ncbi:hypothetical protein [Methylobacterium sp. Leaf106]|uniref:hypothetical protein n=1 Tax=Methylobacterium sp. Leaf106 TaxID=1736255 RepID=UPI001FCCEEFD|nr:hypothetical protein [Methylobacterium sp. Leaf106]